MKIYLIEFNKWDYDQYSGFVVVAENEDGVIKFLKKEHTKGYYGEIDWKGGYKIKEIKPEDYTETAEILGSFHAG